jgi:hypothetical protein
MQPYPYKIDHMAYDKNVSVSASNLENVAYRGCQRDSDGGNHHDIVARDHHKRKAARARNKGDKREYQ